MPRPYEPLLTKFLLQAGKVSAIQVQAAYRAQQTQRPVPPLEVVFVEAGILTHGQVAELFAEQAATLSALDRKIAARAQLWQYASLAIRLGQAEVSDVNRALREHALREESGAAWEALGEVLSRLGVIVSGLMDISQEASPSILIPYLPIPVRPGTPRQGIPAVNAPPPSTTKRPTNFRPTAGEIQETPADSLIPRPRETHTHSRLVGRWIGPYMISEELGRGGMGVVYKAFHPEQKIHVAIKFLSVSEQDAQKAVLRFHREAQAATRLKHPGIVSTQDVAEFDGHTYIVMEFIEGKSLDRLWLESGAKGKEKAAHAAVQPAQAIEYTRQIADALQAAHDAGVIHRDLKPSNILLDKNGRTKVTDFGLAKVLGAAQEKLTRTGTVLGTPAYMSPEMAEGKSAAVDARSDVYQLGTILYELLTGHPPYEGGGMMDLILRIVRGEAPPLPSKWNPAVDAVAEGICRKAMARKPEHRYPTARALAGDCARYLAENAK